MIVALPDELWHLVVDSATWSRSEIRNLRLVSKVFSRAAIPLLFGLILLRPNIDSLKRAQQVSENPHLACHVRKLHIRGDVVSSNIRTAKNFKETIRCWHLPMYDIDALCDSAHQYVKRYPAMIESQESYKEIDSFGATLAVCNKLPNLSLLNFPNMDGDAQSEFSKLYGVEADIGRGFDIGDQLRLSRSVRPKTLIIPMVEWVMFKQLPINGPFHERLFTGLQNVRNLTVRIEYSWRSGYEEKEIDLFRKFWAQTANVEELSLGFFSEEASCDALYKRLVSEILATRWSRLQKLEFVNLVVEQQELHGFLRSHRKTLQDLKFHNLTFQDPIDVNFRMLGCVVKTLIFLRKTLLLQKFRVQSYLGLEGEELYRAQDHGEVDDQLRKIEDFVAHRRDFPFPQIEGMLAVGDHCQLMDITDGPPTQSLDELVEHGTKHRKFDNYEECMRGVYSDRSWYWCNFKHRGLYDDTESRSEFSDSNVEISSIDDATESSVDVSSNDEPSEDESSDDKPSGIEH